MPPDYEEAPALTGASDAGTQIISRDVTLSNPLDAIVSCTKHAETSAIAENPTLREALERIRTGVYARQVSHVQAVLDQYGKGDEYRKAKKSLPAFIAAGTFTKRNNKSLIQHSGVVGFDFDNMADLDAAREAAKLSPHVAYMFVSPSRIGLKIGLRVKPCADDAEHKRAWQAGAEHLREVMGAEVSVDTGCKDVSRLCFVGNDPDLFTNEDATVLHVAEPEPVKHYSEPTAESESDPDELGILSDGNTPAPKRTKRGSQSDLAVLALNRLGDWRVHDYTTWCNVGMVLKKCGCPFPVFDQWSRKSPKHKPGEPAEKWASFDGPDDTGDGARLGLASLERWAHEDNNEPLSLSEGLALEGSELWFAQRIAGEHGQGLKHVWPWRAWIGWDVAAGAWRRDQSATAWQAAKATLKRLLSDSTEVAGTVAGSRMLEIASKFMKKSPLESALKLAASEPVCVALPDEWDANPYLLNCKNGTIDLRDGKLREHRREDRITKSTNVACGGNAPRWRAFLERIIPDSELRDYLQRAVGYSAIGEVTEHVLHIGCGCGANGKSVFFSALSHALGDYAASVPPALLVSNGLNEHPTVIAALHGVRFAVASETEEEGRVRAAQLKALTGGDALTARRMREDYWTFQPSHTLWLQTNHRPQTKEATPGFWRRIRLVPFVERIPASEQDPRLTTKLREEAPGILQWIVEGAARYLTEGLTPPKIILDATAEYQAEQDDMAEFLECAGLVPDPKAFKAAADLYEFYCKWAEGANLKPWGRRTFTSRLRDRGFEYTNKPARGFHVRSA